MRDIQADEDKKDPKGRVSALPFLLLKVMGKGYAEIGKSSWSNITGQWICSSVSVRKAFDCFRKKTEQYII